MDFSRRGAICACDSRHAPQWAGRGLREEQVDTSRCATSELLTKCYYAGCPSCCGYSYIPNAGELLTSQPCCD